MAKVMGLHRSGPACGSPIEIGRNLMKSKRFCIVIGLSARARLGCGRADRPMTG